MDLLTYGSIATFSCVAAIIIYKLIRPCFPVSVTCWFCQASTKVPYGNRNCWDCVHCEQYNGFTSTGDYNKPIPSQYEEDLNYPVTRRNVGPNAIPTTSSPSKLCERCERNQLLKIKQLANFSPIKKGNFDAEVDAYKQKLERAYRLCFPCESRVNLELRRQDAVLKPRLSKYRSDRHATVETDLSLSNHTFSTKELSSPVNSLIRLVSIVISCLLISVLLMHLLHSLNSLSSVQSLHSSPRLKTLESLLAAYYIRLHIAGLLLQTVRVLLQYFKLGLRMMNLLAVFMWLLCYARAVLTEHKLLLPATVLSPIFGVVLSIALGLVSLYAFISVMLEKPGQPTRQYDGQITPPVSEKNSLLSHSSVDSGVTGSYTNAPYNLPPPAYHPPSPTGLDMEMEFTSGGLSSLNIGESRSPNRPASTYAEGSVLSHRSPSVLKKPTFSHSVHSGYSPTHSTYTPVRTNRSPGSISSYHTVAPSNHLSQPPPSQSGYATSRVASVSPSGFRSISGFSPNGSTVYSQPYSVVSSDNTILPRSTPLSTQILLGVSLGINVSIIAFILGRYSADQPLNPFI